MKNVLRSNKNRVTAESGGRFLVRSVFAFCVLFVTVYAGCPKPGKSDRPGENKEGDRAKADFQPTWDLHEFDVNGLKVIYKHTPKNPVVAVRMYFDGGCSNLTPETAGVEELLLSTMEMGGSKKFPMDDLSDALEQRGIQLHAAAGQDYSVLALKSTKEHFETGWNIFSDLTVNPSLGELPLKVQRGRQLRVIRTKMDSPDSQISISAERFFFPRHPYSLMQMGTEANVEKLTVEDLRAHHSKLLNPNRMLLVVVGDLGRKELEKKVRKAFGSLEPAPAKPIEAEVFSHETNRVKYVPRDLPTNYVLGYFSVPRPGQKDFSAARVAAAFLSERLFEELRTKQRLVYAVTAGTAVRRFNIRYIYFATKKPNEAVASIFKQINRLAEEGVSEEDLDEMRSVFITKRLLDLQTQSAQAKLLARAHLVAGDGSWAEKSLADMRAVTGEDVRRVLAEYIKNIQFVLLGPAKVDPQQFRAPKVHLPDGGKE